MLLAILALTLTAFLWGRWRHDLVAMGALLACVATGLVSADAAFYGFGHPAVITVACVLVLGHGLQHAGVVDWIARHCLPASAGPTLGLLALTGLAAVLSGFMNNVGALALLMPVALQMAARHGMAPGLWLMPLAFGSILGGMTTLIGTPPNLIVAGFRAEMGGEPFRMFDFLPVGLPVALTGVLFVGLVGRFLVPARKQSSAAEFDSGAYFSEVRIDARSRAAGKRIAEVEKLLEPTDAQIIALVRRDVRIPAPNARRMLRPDDILVIEVEPRELSGVLSILGLRLEEDVPVEPTAEADRKASDETPADEAAGKGRAEQEDASAEAPAPGEDAIAVQEWVVMPHGAIAGRSARQIALRTRYSVNLLALSRQGRRTIHRLRTTRLRPGDVLLLQGDPEALAGFGAEWGCLPLAPRDIALPRRGAALLAAGLMIAAVVLTTVGGTSAAVAFALAALLYVAFGIVPLRDLYTAVDWPVIVLLGAMLPVANAMSATGAADRIAGGLLEHVAGGHPAAVLGVLMVLTMLLSSLMNNAATAAIMCPIAFGMAEALEVSPDGLLMAVAIGASCAFLTPIAHQNNTLILGPGGFRFGDYWRLGLPLELVTLALGIPLILRHWPL